MQSGKQTIGCKIEGSKKKVLEHEAHRRTVPAGDRVTVSDILRQLVDEHIKEQADLIRELVEEGELDAEDVEVLDIGGVVAPAEAN